MRKNIKDLLFWQNSRNYYYYWRPIGNPSDTDVRHSWSKTHQIPTCLSRDPSETSTCFIERSTCLIGDRHACKVQLAFKHIYLNRLIFIWFLLIYMHWNNVRTLIRHVNLWWVFNYACRSPMCFLLGLYVVSNPISWSPTKHVILLWVSDQKCWSQMGLRWVSW